MTLQPLWACETLRRLDQVALKDLPWLMEVAGAGLADAVARAVAERGLRPGAQVELWVVAGRQRRRRPRRLQAPARARASGRRLGTSRSTGVGGRGEGAGAARAFERIDPDTSRRRSTGTVSWS